jgi:hypothetical protein
MKSLDIYDDGYERELLSLPEPLAFIDFEAMMFAPSPIKFGIPNDMQLPTQFSCHTLTQHGLDWDGKLFHDDYLWEGDWGDVPIFSFVEALYNATLDASTILIYSSYEKTILRRCEDLAIEALAHVDEMDHGVALEYDGRDVVELDSALVDDLVYKCDSMLSRCYDMEMGVKRHLHSVDFDAKSSIKSVGPVCEEAYSRTAELYAAFGIPSNGYAGLGAVHNGSSCLSNYTHALNRPIGAPFPHTTEYECTRYCCLDTLSMVLIYLAVLEQTEIWRSTDRFGDFVEMGDGLFHQAQYESGNAVSLCGNRVEPASDVRLWSRNDIDSIPAPEFFKMLCPACHRIACGR